MDGELERRGHRFVRYADDCNVYVRSKAAGERVMASLERFLGKRLRLLVNREKSAVARPWARKFLGYSVTVHQETKLKVASQSIQRLKAKLQRVFHQGRGRNLGRVMRELGPVLRGWVAYFRLSEVKAGFEAVEAATNPGRETPTTGSGSGTGQGVGWERPRTLVECRSQSHESSGADLDATTAGTPELPR